MKPRKFSFDIPRLKLGPSKADNRALRDHLASSDLDSPPPTPKSVRPPLTPHVDAELRLACASILQNFKPSHIAFEEHGPSKPKQQLDYAAVKGSQGHADRLQVADVVSPSLSRSKSTRAQTRASKIMEGESAAVSTNSEKFRYKPDSAPEGLLKEGDGPRIPIPGPGSRSAVARADHLMSQPETTATVKILTPTPTTGRSRAATGRSRAESHLRSASSPIPHTQPPPAALGNAEVVERPRTVPRTASMETDGSTPETDTTDYPWSEKASTAMTSAAPTPARGSKRTSSQALQSGMEGGSVPKLSMDADWMRVELEKHKRAQEHRVQQRQQEQEQGGEEGAGGKGATDTTPTQMSTHAAPSPSRLPVKATARKPVPAVISHTDNRQEQSRSDSRQDDRSSTEEANTNVPLVKTVPRTDSTQDPQSVQERAPRTRSRAARPIRERSSSRARSRVRSVTRQVKEYIRPGTSASTAQRTIRPEDATAPSEEFRQRSSSRAGRGRPRSVTRQVKDYFRPGASAVNSRKPSVDLSNGRSESRGRSIDTFRSALSEAAQSTASANAKWRTWKPSMHRRRGSQSDNNGDSSRPGTSGSASEARGRAPSRERQQEPSQQQKAKLAIDLNRKLPPLPGLDKWKDDEAEAAPKSHKSRGSRQERSATVGVQSNRLSREEVLAARMGSPSSPGKSSMDAKRQRPPQPCAPPPPPPVLMSANFSCAADFDYAHFSPESGAVPVEISGTSNRIMKARPRSVDANPTYSAEFGEKVKCDSLLQPAAADKPTPGKAQAVNNSRAAGGPLHGGLRRKISQAGRVGLRRPTPATTAHESAGHSRDPSSNAGEYTRKASSQDDANRVLGGEYANLVEITSTPSKGSLPTATAAVKDKGGKGKWWQRSAGKEKRSSPTWMDQVVKSGSRGGVVLADEFAGAPIVRY